MLIEQTPPLRTPLAAQLSEATVDTLRAQLGRMGSAELDNARAVFDATLEAWQRTMYINGVPRGGPAMPKDVAEAGRDIVAELLPAALEREQAEHDRLQAEARRRERAKAQDQLEECRQRAVEVAQARQQYEQARAAAAEALAGSWVGQLLDAEAALRSRSQAFEAALRAAGPTATQLAVLEALGDASTAARQALGDHLGALPPAPAPQLPHGWLVDLLVQLPLLLENVRQLNHRVAQLDASSSLAATARGSRLD